MRDKVKANLLQDLARQSLKPLILTAINEMDFCLQAEPVAKKSNDKKVWEKSLSGVGKTENVTGIWNIL